MINNFFQRLSQSIQSAFSTPLQFLFTMGGIFLFILSIGAFLVTLKYSSKDSVSQKTITVSGHGEIKAKPDIATISFTVRKENKDGAKAQEEAGMQMKQIMTKLDALVKKEDMQTSYAISPQYDWVTKACNPNVDCISGGKQTLRGYEVVHNITLIARELDKVSKIISLLGQEKVENLSGPNFSIENPQEITAKAREIAIEKARKDAKKLAQNLGTKLGKIISYSDSNGGNPMPFMGANMQMKSLEMNDMAVSASSPISNQVVQLPIGNETVTSDVTIVFELK
jgi:uncharacterized protein